jgi:NTE family protein
MSVDNSEDNKIYTAFKDKNIGLALSGGGHRAAVFHLGVLSYLAENGLLENVKHLSTVSGGSVVMGIIYRLNAYKFPDSQTYLEQILPNIRPYFTEYSLQGNALLNMLKKLTFVNRHSILSYTLKGDWKIDVNMQDINDKPIWSINTTTLETGKSWRIEKQKMGSHDLGYIHFPEMDLADAIAASAGFPIGIGPLELDLGKYDIPKKMAGQKSLLLYDGGLYDNLGVEVLLKKNFTAFAKGIDFVMVSDASKPLEHESVGYLGRVGRLIDVSTEQIRSLKVRMFHKFLHENKGDGMHIRIGTEYANLNQDAHYAKSVPTDLKKMSKKDFDSLQANGYTTAMKMFDKYILGLESF